MTELQALQKMKADIQLRGLSKSTFENYTRNVKAFLEFCNKPLEDLDENDVRRYLGYLIIKKKRAPRTVNQHSAAIRFFFAIGLNRTMNYLQMPLMKVPKTLPDVLTREEVSALIGVCDNLKHKALLLLSYGSGLRSSEVTSLRIKDIDSKEMRVFIKRGKSNNDHYSVLSQSTLNALREYWRRYRPDNPEGYLFPGTKNVGHITRAAIALAFEQCVNKTAIAKEVSPHSLRHAFATHLLEDGVDIIKIKEMLGHRRIQSTMRYLHLLNPAKGIQSPADAMDAHPVNRRHD